MEPKRLLSKTLEKMKAAGFDKVQLQFNESEKHELNQQHNDINLLRTGFNTTLNITGIRDNKKASLSLNSLNAASIEEAIHDLSEMAEASPQDSAYDIAPFQQANQFILGATEVNAELMYDRLAAFISYSKVNHPTTILEDAVIDFTMNKTRIVNSNGLDFFVQQGMYSASVMFTSKEGNDTSSFNYTGFSSTTLDKELKDEGYLAELLKQSTEQVRTRQIPEKFKGDLIITPHAFDEFINFLCSNISDVQMIAGSSIYDGKINTAVASPLVSIHCKPVSGKLAESYPLTSDGIIAKDMTLIDKGELKSYLLGQYGSNKTGLAMSDNDGNCMIMESGDNSLEEIIAGVQKGVLLGRFSGGNPNDKGDFSGVAKNSYYIENGKIQYPISETMVSGNIASLLKDIDAVSTERVNFGNSILPWVRSRGFVIS